MSLKDVVLRLDDVHLDDLLLAASTERRTDALDRNLAKLHKVACKLQSNNCTLSKTGVYPDRVLDLYQTLEARLNSGARTVQILILRCAAQKIWEGRIEVATTSASSAAKSLLPPKLSEMEIAGFANGSIGERALKRLKNTIAEERHDYMNT